MQVIVTLDCHDPEALAPFWEGALRYRRTRATGPYVALVPDGVTDGPTLLLQRVPEPKVGKNRMHLDLRVRDLDMELARLLRLGATKESELIDEDGFRWYVVADPEGNELCVITSAPETAPS